MEADEADEGEAEQVARHASQESGLDDRPRCDPRVLAVSYCGLTLLPWHRARTRLVHGTIWYPAEKPEAAQAYLVAHEVGHFLIAGGCYSREVEERVASRIGVALLLPRKAYLRDLRSTGSNLRVLSELWPLASPWVHARRITELCRDVSASRWIRGRCVARTAKQRPTDLSRWWEFDSELVGLHTAPS